MYRIDLSQVVNKYIGETEKNLKRVFDAADVSDMILFFDEADALFGRRTEVSDAHDRYANLEISYLLERMERFKGLAILATNRKKDLDEAFLRRLRYVVDFPLPDASRAQAESGGRSSQNTSTLAGSTSISWRNSFRWPAATFARLCLTPVCNAPVDQRGHEQQRRRPDDAGDHRRREARVRQVEPRLSLEQYGRYARLVEGLDHE